MARLLTQLKHLMYSQEAALPLCKAQLGSKSFSLCAQLRNKDNATSQGKDKSLDNGFREGFPWDALVKVSKFRGKGHGQLAVSPSPFSTNRSYRIDHSRGTSCTGPEVNLQVKVSQEASPWEASSKNCMRVLPKTPCLSPAWVSASSPAFGVFSGLPDALCSI